MNKEVHYEGWLIKSPPTKRIWRARWRRRWFTLKQGEIPEQFCLEYYTDRNCRKLKGVIDLDQCEQVDCGLRLENRKQKFQFMFDIKTPKRTYYLAADTEADMCDWVNCICQVCHLLDTKQSNELLQDSNPSLNAPFLIPQTNAAGKTAIMKQNLPSIGSASVSSNNTSLLNNSNSQASCNTSIQLRRQAIVDQPPNNNLSINNNNNTNNNNNSIDCPYVNTEYSNRETLVCDMRFDSKQVTASTSPQSSPSGAIYLNSPLFGAKQQRHEPAAPRLAVSSNGIVRKIPENLVLSNVSLSENKPHTTSSQSQLSTQQQLHQYSVQPSPAPSTASGPYIPISECFSGSPKFSLDGNNPTTPLNNLDPKFYDTPRCHNNIGLNLTNDQSYSPKITNCNLQQLSSSSSATKNRSHRSDSDSESVFTDDEEWARPLPLRENMDRSTRPSDSSVENESFVLTYSQRFSKVPESIVKEQQHTKNESKITVTSPSPMVAPSKAPIVSLSKVLKNKNNLMLDFTEQEKIQCDPPQLSDTENTSPAIGPRDSKSVVEESYDIPRSHNLPYYNMGTLFEKTASPETNPIAASTPNLMISSNAVEGGIISSPEHVRTLPRPHCYTNAAPSKVEGNVFRYDFIEQDDVPPVNRKLKPKMNLEDKPPEEAPAKPPNAMTPVIYDNLAIKLMESVNIQSSTVANTGAPVSESTSPAPPSVDRNLKPSLYKTKGSSIGSTTSRRSIGAPLSMVLTNDNESYILETRTLPRQPRSNLNNDPTIDQQYFGSSQSPLSINSSATVSHHLQKSPLQSLQLPTKNEHKLQYFDLDVTNPPQINRQSMSVGNLSSSSGASRGVGLTANPSARAPPKSGVVYNLVDFVKTEAFKRIREERKKQSEVNTVSGNTTSSNGSTLNTNNK